MKRGFASFSKEKREQTASKGGKSSKPEDRAFSRDKELASRAAKLSVISREKNKLARIKLFQKRMEDLR